MASRADLAAHRRQGNPQGCVAAASRGGRKSAAAGEIPVKLCRIALPFN